MSSVTTRRRRPISKRVEKSSVGVIADSERPLGEPANRMDGSPMADDVHDASTAPTAGDPDLVATKKGTITSGDLASAGKLAPARRGKSMPDQRLTKQDGPPIATQDWHGLSIAIEHTAGDIRHPEGPFPTLIPGGISYGYFQGVPGEDGDSLDAILGPKYASGGDIADQPYVFLAAQSDPNTGEFVQHKVMLFFEEPAEAEAAFKLMWPSKMFAGLFTVPVEQFVDFVLPKLRAEKKVDATKLRKAEAAPIDIWADVASMSTNKLERMHHDVHVAVAKAELNTSDAANFHARIVNELRDRSQLHPPAPDLDLDPISADLEKRTLVRRSFDPPSIDFAHAPRTLVAKRNAKPIRSAGGKDMWVNLFKDMMPPHKTFTEAYAGSASFFFAKERSEREVLIDLDPAIIEVYQFLQTATAEDFAWIRNQRWDWSDRNFESLKKQDAERLDPKERMYRFKYLNIFSQRGTNARIDNSPIGRSKNGTVFLRGLEKFQKRLEGVTLVCADAIEGLKKYDAPDAFHYIDPPWRTGGAARTLSKIGGGFDEAALLKFLETVKGRVLLSYQGDITLKSFHHKEVQRSQGGYAGETTQQLFWNYDTEAVVKAERDHHEEMKRREALKAAKPISRTFTVTGVPSVIDQVERALAAAQRLGEVGSSRTLRLSIDGDGPERLQVEGLSNEIDGATFDAISEQDEFSVAQVEWLEKRSRKKTAKSRFAIQEHWNGDQGHSILRLAISENECLSWALDTALAAPTKIATVAKAASIDGVSVLQGAMRARALPPAPAAWLDIEAASHVLGVEKSADPSVFRLVDGGEFELGFVRDDFREVFLKGEHVRRRLVLRKIELVDAKPDACVRCDKAPETIVRWAHGWAATPVCKSCHPAWFAEVAKAAVDRELPGVVETVPYSSDSYTPGVIVAKGLGSGTPAWIALWQSDTTPVALKQSVTAPLPVGMAAVPQGIQAQVPEERRWWLAKSAEESFARRTAFIAAGFDVRAALGSAESTVERFALQKSTRDDGAVAWSLHIDRAGDVVTLHLDGDPRAKKTSVQIEKCVSPAIIDIEGDLSRAHRANTTGRPLRVEKMDAGEMVTAVHEDDFVRVVLKGKSLSGVFELEKDQDSWALVKRGEATAKIEVLKRESALRLPIQKLQEEKRLVTGVVLEPDEIDAHGDFEREETIERAAHRFVSRLNRGTGLGIQHSIFGETGVELVESWIAREDTTVEGKKVKKGTWLMTVKVLSDKIWAKVKSGAITGFSIGGSAAVEAPGEPTHVEPVIAT